MSSQSSSSPSSSVEKPPPRSATRRAETTTTGVPPELRSQACAHTAVLRDPSATKKTAVRHRCVPNAALPSRLLREPGRAVGDRNSAPLKYCVFTSRCARRPRPSSARSPVLWPLPAVSWSAGMTTTGRFQCTGRTPTSPRRLAARSPTYSLRRTSDQRSRRHRQDPRGPASRNRRVERSKGGPAPQRGEGTGHNASAVTGTGVQHAASREGGLSWLGLTSVREGIGISGRGAPVSDDRVGRRQFRRAAHEHHGLAAHRAEQAAGRRSRRRGRGPTSACSRSEWSRPSS